jgi:hypothetical protein
MNWGAYACTCAHCCGGHFEMLLVQGIIAMLPSCQVSVRDCNANQGVDTKCTACGAIMHFHASMPYVDRQSGDRLPAACCMLNTYLFGKGLCGG